MDRLPLNVLHAALRPIGSNCGTGAGGRELQLEGSAYAKLTLNVDLTGMLLHDPIADRISQPGPFGGAVLGLGLRRKKWIVDAVEMFPFDAASAVLDSHQHTTGT